jgi:serine/threonine protein kinase
MGSVCSSAETPAVKFNPAPIDSLYELDDVVLGESGSTVVKRAKRRTDGLAVAFKMLPRAEVMDEEADWTHFQMEVNVMQTLQHPGILKLYDVFEEKEQVPP